MVPTKGIAQTCNEGSLPGFIPTALLAFINIGSASCSRLAYAEFPQSCFVPKLPGYTRLRTALIIEIFQGSRTLNRS